MVCFPFFEAILGIVAAHVVGKVVHSGHHVVNFSTWGFGIYKTAHRTWLRILSTALEKELKVLVCLMTTLLLFILLRLFSFVSAFLTSLIKLIL